MTYKNCEITITGSDMYYKAIVDMGLTKVYVVHYYNETYNNVKKDIKKRLRNMFIIN